MVKVRHPQVQQHSQYFSKGNAGLKGCRADGGKGETHVQMGDGSSVIPVIVVVLVSLLGLQGEAVLREVDRHDDRRHSIG